MEIHYVDVGNQVCLQRIIFVHRAAAPTLSCSASIAYTGFGDLICFSPKSKFNWVQDVLIFAFPKLIGFPKLSGLRMLQGFFSNYRCKQWMSDSAFCARLTYISPEDVAKLPGTMPEGWGGNISLEICSEQISIREVHTGLISFFEGGCSENSPTRIHSVEISFGFHFAL